MRLAKSGFSWSAGFDMYHFYLQQEKEQLAKDKERQQLDLKIKENQLRNSVTVIALAFLRAVLLGGSLWYQRKKRRELASQHVLMQQQAERLRSLDESKSRFFANVSHERVHALAPIETAHRAEPQPIHPRDTHGLCPSNARKQS